MALLDPSLVVVVTVNKTTAIVSRQGFATPMGVFQVPTAVQSDRFKTYASTQEMLDAGFAATDRAVLWATVVKAAGVQRFGIGRRVEGTAQVDTVTITTPDTGTWDVTINGVTFAYVAGASDTAQTIAEGLKAAIDGGTEPVVTSTPAAGVFTVTALVPGEAFTNGGITVPGAGAGTFTNTTANVAAEAIATTLAAILAEDSTTWYLFTIETRNDTDITAANTFVTPLKKQFFGQSRDADAKAGTPTNIFDTIQALNNPRTSLFWHELETEYLDGGAAATVAAFNLDAAEGAGTLAHKQIAGVTTDNLTSAEVINIAGDGESNLGFGGNVYVEIAERGVVLWGNTTEGEFIDVQQGIDWTFFRAQEAVFGSLATTPTKIPYTNAGIAVVKNDLKGVLDRGVTNGIFSNDDPDFPRVEVPDANDVDVADKNSRVLRNVRGFAKLAGAIHKVYIQIDVSV